VILKNRGDLAAAMALHKHQERLCRKLGNKDGLQRTLGNQALILSTRGDLGGAMALSKEQERLCRELGNPEGLAISLANQADLLSNIAGRGPEARRLADEALAIANRYGFQRLVPQIQRIRGSIPPGVDNGAWACDPQGKSIGPYYKGTPLTERKRNESPQHTAALGLCDLSPQQRC
jgi:hypothetical protein